MSSVPPVPANAPPPLAPVPAADAYFPPGLLKGVKPERFNGEWFAMQLVAMREPPLLASTGPGEHSLRFLWLRSFHVPIAILVHRGASGATLTAVKLTRGQDILERYQVVGYQPGSIQVYRTRHLTEDEWSALLALFSKTDHDALPSLLPSRGADGANWVLESARDGRYHVVDRWSPYASEALRVVCERMLDLAGRDLAGNAVY